MARMVEGPKERHVTCDECHGTIAYLPEDIERRDELDIAGLREQDGYRRVKCPRVLCPGYGYIERW